MRIRNKKVAPLPNSAKTNKGDYKMTITELKENADKFIWTMNQHSYGHKAIGVPREVRIKQKNSIMFSDMSWLEFPKAKDSCFFMSSGELCFAIQIAPEEDPKAQIVYTLKRKETYDNQRINEISK